MTATHHQKMATTEYTEVFLCVLKALKQEPTKFFFIRECTEFKKYLDGFIYQTNEFLCDLCGLAVDSG